MVTHLNSSDWPETARLLKSLGVKAYVFEQTTSLLTMMGLITVFSMKKIDNKLLSIFGVYSYEIYMLHWPLMAHYDIFFHTLPAWLAVFCWLLAFLAIGWLLQKITVPLSVWIDNMLKPN
jgi:peptidoglycan/LPS O-acetylase OafA/YrhL